MKLIQDLIAGAVEDEKRMTELANEGMRDLARQEAYSRLENILSQMSADGYFDEKELEQLKAEFRALGLSTSTIERVLLDLESQDGVHRVQADELAFVLRTEIGAAKSESRLGPDYHLEVQQVVDGYHLKINTVAMIQKSQHDKYMTAIKNI